MKFIKKHWILISTLLLFIVCGVLRKPEYWFLFIGILVLHKTFQTIYLLRKIGRNRIRCLGKITSYEIDNEGLKRPVVEYAPNNSQIIRVKPFYYSATDLTLFRSYSKNMQTEVSILYDPKDFNKIIIEKEKTFNVLTLSLFIIVSTLFIILGMCGLFGIIEFWKY